MSEDSEITRTIIPAQPGWHVAWPREHEGDYYGFFLDPIVAWAVDNKSGEPTPLCIEGSPSVVNTYDEWAVKTPDGWFFFPHADTFDSEARALAYVQAVMKHRLAK